MNLIEMEIEEVIKGPYENSNGDWEVVVKYYDWGGFKERTFVSCCEKSAQKYKKGYTWSE